MREGRKFGEDVGRSRLLKRHSVCIGVLPALVLIRTPVWSVVGRYGRSRGNCNSALL